MDIENRRRGGAKNARARGQGVEQQKGVFWTQHNCYTTHERCDDLHMICTRLGHSELIPWTGERAHEAPLLSGLCWQLTVQRDHSRTMYTFME